MSEEQFTGPMRVDIVENSKSGKSWRVNLGGKWYGAYKEKDGSAGILDALLKNVYVITGTLEKGGPWIMKWKLADATTAIAAPHSASPRASTPSLAPNVAPWWMAFVSNTVAHAIQAGHIKEPKQIGPWAKSAADNAVALVEAEQEVPPAEDVPF